MITVENALPLQVYRGASVGSIRNFLKPELGFYFRSEVTSHPNDLVVGLIWY